MITTTLDKQGFKEEHRRKTAKPLLWLGIVSIIMFFGGLTSAVLVRMADPGWEHIQLPAIFTLSTILLIGSSVMFILANKSAKKDNYSGVKQYLYGSLIFGVGFAVCQFIGWGQLVDLGYFFTGAESTPASSYLYVLTAVHLAHLVGGFIALIISILNSHKHKYNSKNLLGLQLCSIYWHFMDGLWIYIYLFLTFVA